MRNLKIITKAILAFTLAKTFSKETIEDSCFFVRKASCSNCETNAQSDYEFEIEYDREKSSDFDKIEDEVSMVQYKVLFPKGFLIWVEESTEIELRPLNPKISEDFGSEETISGFTTERAIHFFTKLSTIKQSHKLIIKNIDNPVTFGYLNDFDFEISIPSPNITKAKNDEMKSNQTLLVISLFKLLGN